MARPGFEPRSIQATGYPTSLPVLIPQVRALRSVVGEGKVLKGASQALGGPVRSHRRDHRGALTTHPPGFWALCPQVPSPAAPSAQPWENHFSLCLSPFRRDEEPGEGCGRFEGARTRKCLTQTSTWACSLLPVFPSPGAWPGTPHWTGGGGATPLHMPGAGHCPLGFPSLAQERESPHPQLPRWGVRRIHDFGL